MASHIRGAIDACQLFSGQANGNAFTPSPLNPLDEKFEEASACHGVNQLSRISSVSHIFPRGDKLLPRKCTAYSLKVLSSAESMTSIVYLQTSVLILWKLFIHNLTCRIFGKLIQEGDFWNLIRLGLPQPPSRLIGNGCMGPCLPTSCRSRPGAGSFWSTY